LGFADQVFFTIQNSINALKIVQRQELNFKSHDWLKVAKQETTEFKFHNKLLTVVEQHIIAFLPLALTHALR